jgi:hypothetical protein
VASTDELRLSFKKNPIICEARGSAGSLRRHPQVWPPLPSILYLYM